MTEQQDGIDMARSGWENPEGFKPRERPPVEVPPAPDICGDIGPGGWACELKPGHQLREHRADDGSPTGVRWAREQVEVTGPRAMNEGRQEFAPGRIVRDPGVVRLIEARAEGMRQIRDIAETALKSESPAAWVLALDKIRGMVS